MRLAVLNDKVIGKRLEMPIFSSEGSIILNKSAVLSEKIIYRLRQMGVGTVYVDDDAYSEVIIQEIIDAPFRYQIIKSLKQIFEQAKKKRDLDVYKVKDIINGVLDNMVINENSIVSINNIDNSKNDICSHSLNVALYSLILGISMGYNYSQLYDLGVGALLHDIGKMISEGPNHTDEGFKFLRTFRELSANSNICAYSHHENMDGTGFPRGTKGEQINTNAKIVSICSEYDNLNLSGDLLPYEVMERLSAEVGRKFDPVLYKDFVQVIYCYPNGLPVKLSNGAEGVVVMQNKSFPQRPIVKINNTGSIYCINLMENLNLFIEDVLI